MKKKHSKQVISVNKRTMVKLTNIQLKNILRSRNLIVTGNKKDLIERLENDLVENCIDPEEYIINNILLMILQKLNQVIAHLTFLQEHLNLNKLQAV